MTSRKPSSWDSFSDSSPKKKYSAECSPPRASWVDAPQLEEPDLDIDFADISIPRLDIDDSYLSCNAGQSSHSEGSYNRLKANKYQPKQAQKSPAQNAKTSNTSSHSAYKQPERTGHHSPDFPRKTTRSGKCWERDDKHSGPKPSPARSGGGDRMSMWYACSELDYMMPSLHMPKMFPSSRMGERPNMDASFPKKGAYKSLGISPYRVSCCDIDEPDDDLFSLHEKHRKTPSLSTFMPRIECYSPMTCLKSPTAGLSSLDGPSIGGHYESTSCSLRKERESSSAHLAKEKLERARKTPPYKEDVTFPAEKSARKKSPCKEDFTSSVENYAATRWKYPNKSDQKSLDSSLTTQNKVQKPPPEPPTSSAIDTQPEEHSMPKPTSSDGAPLSLENPLTVEKASESEEEEEDVVSFCSDSSEWSEERDPLDGIACLSSGMLFDGKYTLETGSVLGKPSIRFATGIISGERFALKFYSSEQEFNNCRRLQAFSPGSLCISRPVDIILAHDGFPNCIVYPKGLQTFEEWIKEPNPTCGTKKKTVQMIGGVLGDVHREDIVLGDVRPSKFMFFERDNYWKLLNFDSGVRRGERTVITTVSSYSAPEVIRAAHAGKAQIKLDTSADVWSYGVMAYEVLIGEKLYGAEPTMETVLEFLEQEKIDACLNAIEDKKTRRFLNRLLRLDPKERRSADRATCSSLFNTSKFVIGPKKNKKKSDKKKQEDEKGDGVASTSKDA